MRFVPGVSVERSGGLWVRSAVHGEIDLSASAAELDAVCAALAGEGATTENLLDLAKLSGSTSVAVLLNCLERLRGFRLIEWVLSDGEQDIAVFTSLMNGFCPSDPKLEWAAHRLSRLAYLRRDGDALVLESPETPCRVYLSATAAKLLMADVAASGGRTADPDDGLLAALGRFGFLEPAKQKEEQARASWSFADAVIHMASRRGRDDPALGLNIRLQNAYPAPAEDSPHSKDVIRLPPAPTDHTPAGSRPLDRVMAARRSVRVWADQPLSLDNVSEFLFRVATPRPQGIVGSSEAADKPIPSAGSIQDLAWYVSAGRVAGLAPALYRYDRSTHGLVPIQGSSENSASLLRAATLSLGPSASEPPALIMLASRMPHLAWKYQGLAYRLTLLNVGVALEAMYLVATDMGLGGCAIGTGDPRPFEAATGLPWFDETPVGEFALGFAAAEPPKS